MLVDDRHAGQTYDVTGSEALSLEEAVGRLAQGGADLHYAPETIEEGRAWRAASGAAGWEIDVWLGSYFAMGTGELAQVSTAVHDITDREPQRLGVNPQ